MELLSHKQFLFYDITAPLQLISFQPTFDKQRVFSVLRCIFEKIYNDFFDRKLCCNPFLFSRRCGVISQCYTELFRRVTQRKNQVTQGEFLFKPDGVNGWFGFPVRSCSREGAKLSYIILDGVGFNPRPVTVVCARITNLRDRVFKYKQQNFKKPIGFSNRIIYI